MNNFDLDEYLERLNEIYSSESKNVEEKLYDLVREYNIIFEYRLGDAWGMPDYWLFIIDKDNNNVCYYKENESVFKTISKNEIETIKKYIFNNQILFDDDKLEVCPPILDGTSDYITVSTNEKTRSFDTGNTWYWLENDVMKSDNEIGDKEYTKAIVDLLLLIRKTLLKHDLIINYDYEDEYEEDE